MPKKTGENTNRIIFIVIAAVAAIAILIGIWYWIGKSKQDAADQAVDQVVQPVESQQVLDYDKMEEDSSLKDLMDKRKEELGVGEGIDMIAKHDESLKIGESTVPMREIMEKIQLKIGDIVEKDIMSDRADATPSIRDFGIYVVQPEDNIWNVHFRFLQDYFQKKGVTLSPLSDEPGKEGFSSGVGKLLKFSESIVYIYNIEKRDLDIDLNMIQPLNKLVVYNMDRIFSLLDQIDYSDVDRIQFDGETLWLSVED